MLITIFLITFLMIGDPIMANTAEKIMIQADTIEEKDFTSLPGNLEGISEEQLNQHLKLYKGYVAKVNEINEKLENIDPSTGNHNYSEYRSLKVELAHNLNGAVLHEMYFSNLTPDYKEPSQELKNLVEKSFGSWDKYIQDLKGAGMASRAGWVMTGYNYRNGKIQNFVVDQHIFHVPAFIRPVLIMDTWEHAFMIDYGIDKKSYINAFLDNVNWQTMHERLKSTLETDKLLDKSTD